MNIRIVVSMQDENECNHLSSLLAESFAAQVIFAGQLYDLPDDHELWTLLSEPCDVLVVLAQMHPRPVMCLLQTRGASYSNLHCIDIRIHNDPLSAVSEALESLNESYQQNPGQSELIELKSSSGSRWYPIIDRALCVSCGQCEQFCLFGVYSNTNGVSVEQPDNCKPGCPACSRICPQGAIIFPMYHKDPAICGVPGHKMSPDPEARKMYYQRTGKACPVCADDSTSAAYAGGKCAECGKDIPAKDDKQIDNELDKLIDEFDKLQFGG